MTVVLRKGQARANAYRQRIISIEFDLLFWRTVRAQSPPQPYHMLLSVIRNTPTGGLFCKDFFGILEAGFDLRAAAVSLRATWPGWGNPSGAVIVAKL